MPIPGQDLYDIAYKTLRNISPPSKSIQDVLKSDQWTDSVNTCDDGWSWWWIENQVNPSKKQAAVDDAAINAPDSVDNTDSFLLNNPIASIIKGLLSRVIKVFIVKRDIDKDTELDNVYDHQSSSSIPSSSKSFSTHVHGDVKVHVPVIHSTDSPVVKRAKAVAILQIAGYSMGNQDSLMLLGDMFLV